MMNRYSKAQCLDKDWSNPKSITAEEIAYCILTYKLDREVPLSVCNAVSKELNKLISNQQKEDTKATIEAMLDTYHYDPDLFTTAYEVETAFAEEAAIINREMNKLNIYNHQYKDNNYSRDLSRTTTKLRDVRKELIRLGYSQSQIDNALAIIDDPHLNTLLQEVNTHRDSITEVFVSLGVPKTRASTIAIAITTNAYFALLSMQ